jgi:hypothetical protein
MTLSPVVTQTCNDIVLKAIRLEQIGHFLEYRSAIERRDGYVLAEGGGCSGLPNPEVTPEYLRS